MYYQVISQCVQMLKNLESWLDKAVAHAAAKKFDVGVLMMAGRLAPTQQVTGGTVICGSIAEGIGNDQGACDGRQHFGGVAWREPFRN